MKQKIENENKPKSALRFVIMGSKSPLNSVINNVSGQIYRSKQQTKEFTLCL